jgi:hypothetical protein
LAKNYKPFMAYTQTSKGDSFYFPAGTTARFRFYAKATPTGLPLDLTGYTVTGILKKKEVDSDSDAIITATTGSGGIVIQDLVLGIFDWVFAAGDTQPEDYTPGRPWFRLIYIENNAGTKYVLAGSAGDVHLDAVTAAVGSAGIQVGYAPSVRAEAIGPDDSPTPAYATMEYVDDKVATSLRGTIVTANYTASAGEIVLVDSSSGSFTVTLPTPTLGAGVTIKDVGNSLSTYPVTVNRSSGVTLATLSVSGTQAAWHCKATTTNSGGGTWVRTKAKADDVMLATPLPNATDAEAAIAYLQYDKQSALSANPLRKTFTKLRLLLSGTSAQQVGYMVMGDSLGYRKAKYLAARLRAAFATAGLHGPTCTGGSCFTTVVSAASPTITTTGTDYRQTPSGGWTTLASTGQSVGGLFLAPGYAATYSPGIFPELGVLNADSVSVYYVQEPGAGTFNTQVTSDGTNWTTVDSAFSAAGATVSFKARTISITAQQVRGVRTVWVSGSTKHWGVGARASTTAGVVLSDFSVGSVDMASQATCVGLGTVLSGIAPDFVTLEARDNTPGVGLTPALPAIEALFTTLPDRIYCGMSQWATDTDQAISDYNAAIQAYAVANGAAFFDSAAYTGNNATMSALGWLTGSGDDHPNDNASHYTANFLLRDTGLLAPLTAGQAQRIDAARLGGVLYARGVAFGSVGCAASSVETDLMSYTLPANVVTTDGDTLLITAKFNETGGAVNRRIRCYALGTVVADTTLITQGGGYEFTVTLTRGSAAQTVVSRLIQYYNSLGRVEDNQSLSIGLVLGGIIKFTGVGVSANDVTQQSMIVELKKVPV